MARAMKKEKTKKKQPMGEQPKFSVKLTPEEREDVADQLADILILIAKKEQDARDDATSRRKALKTLRTKRDELRDERKSGMRQKGEQPELFDEEGGDA